MYTPYGNVGQNNLQHPQPQHAASYLGQSNQYQGQSNQYQQQAPQQLFQQQQQQQHTQSQGAPYNFLNDPAASMAAQFAKSSFGTSNQYIQQNFGTFIPGTSDLKYYFKVNNSYVFNKVRLILFPYRNNNWNRLSLNDTSSSDTTPNPTPGNNLVSFAPPTIDVNAPDLYIPLMAYITYILLWSVFQGIQGDFHPQLFGYLASQTLACSFLDIVIFKVGLYLLNCSTQSSIWDLIAFSGYKYVSIIVLLCWKHLVSGGWITYYSMVLFITVNLALFLMRSLKFMVLPSSDSINSSNSISSKQRRIRIQFLFLYAGVVQFLIILFMSK